MKRAVVVIALLCGAPTLLTGQAAGLKGVKSFDLTVAGSNPEMALPMTELQTHIELKLRSAGLPLKNSGQVLPDAPFLAVRVTIKGLRDEIVSAYFIDVTFTDWVTIKRDGVQKEVLGQVYGVSTVFLARFSDMRAKVLADLDADLETFMNDFLKANPKSGG